MPLHSGTPLPADEELADEFRKNVQMQPPPAAWRTTPFPDRPRTRRATRRRTRQRLLRRARCAPAPPRALRDDEQARLLNVLERARGVEAERDRMLIHLLLQTGIRIGSALALDVEDVDLAHGELALRSTKGDRPTTALLPAATALRGFIGKRDTGPLFLAHGNRICMRHAQRRISNWFAAAGIQGKSAHSCRHYFACALLGKTGDLRLAQNALNHASIVSTTIYAQIDREKLRTAVGV
jgi:integrase/recombinase XerC